MSSTRKSSVKPTVLTSVPTKVQEQVPTKVRAVKNNKVEIKILKSSINIILNSGVEIKNINMNNWNIIKNLL